MRLSVRFVNERREQGSADQVVVHARGQRHDRDDQLHHVPACRGCAASTWITSRPSSAHRLRIPNGPRGLRSWPCRYRPAPCAADHQVVIGVVIGGEPRFPVAERGYDRFRRIDGYG